MLNRYDIMLQCWQFKMMERPTFKALASMLQDMLEDVV